MTAKSTPESLFERIAQDNKILNEFRHHSFRVMYLASLLGKQVNTFDEDLRIAALLHDIGKMGLSSQILFKQGKLTSLEQTIIQSHCHVGNVIVRKEIGNNQAAQFVRDHHENWNGSGYPRGLAGEEISIQGRIIRICDSFDVMTYDVRNYSSTKMSYQEAFEELRACSWQQFDGDLVEAFIELLTNIEFPDASHQVFDQVLLRSLYEKMNKANTNNNRQEKIT